jgi:endonuclease/exonuclease/phosphatase family metal-dependent hydrolase
MAEPVLRVVQLNVGSLLEPGWARRRHEVVAWLGELRPDVACFQEVWEDAKTSNTARWLVEQLPELSYRCAFGGAPFEPSLWPDPSMRFGSAVLSRWPIEDSTYHTLPIHEDVGDGFVAKVPWELLHVRTAGIDLFSCHLAPAPTHGLHRRVQVLAIDEIIRTARGELDAVGGLGHHREAMPVILCGDFNAEPDSDEIRFLCSLATLDGRTAFYQDAWRVAGDGPGYTQDWRTNSLADAMNLHRKRIDYVFVGDPFQRRGRAGRVLAASLAFDEPRTGVHASDHCGLCVDIVWPQRPAEEQINRP